MISFVPSAPVTWALFAGAATPICVLAVSRWRGALGPGAKFLLGYGIAVALWVSAVAAPLGAKAGAPDQILLGLLAILAAGVGWANLWGVLTRGYTLRLLLDFLRLAKPVTREELGAAYSGGRGLDWMFRKRLATLAAFGLTRRRNGLITMTSFPGRAVAQLSLIGLRLLGMKRSW